MLQKFRESLAAITGTNDKKKKNRKRGGGGGTASIASKKGRVRRLGDEEYHELLAQEGDDKRSKKNKEKAANSKRVVPGAESLQDTIDQLKTVSFEFSTLTLSSVTLLLIELTDLFCLLTVYR
jgi:hypothetical protein